MYPHRIRLRGPWECEPEGLPPRRVTMPCRWSDAGLAGFRGRARFTRKFGYPGKADPEFEHIWLTCEGCTGCLEVNLNGTPLSPLPTGGEAFAFDVSTLLTDRNRLDVVIDGQTDDAGLWGEVALEIRKDAYLAGVRAEWTVGQDSEPVNADQATGSESCPTGKLSISGNVFGTAPQPLEMYTILDRRNADYRTIVPSPGGTPFRIDLVDVPPSCEMARVELVHISSIWYAIELPISHWKSS